MKYILILIAMALLISCKGKKSNNASATKDTTLQVCDFGIDNFNSAARVLPPDEELQARTKKPREPIKPPPPSGSSPSGVILLDFDGQIVSSTSWNYAGDINCSSAALTLEERQMILDTVAKRFAGFNLIVTSNESLYNAAPINKRTRCILTDTHEWFGAAGGVSFMNSFTSGVGNPCFIFTKALNYSIKKIQEAATHEIGHTLGLYHQAVYDSACNKISEYNFGGNGEAPIMGVGYYQPNVRWWVGATALGCNQIQNDTALIRAVTK